KDIGISAPPMKDQLEGLKARIFQGASRVELGFTGVGKGSMGQGQPTPGSYGKDEREAMRDLAKLNKVELTTHATLGVSGLAGFSRQGNLDESEREKSLHEIQRAVDFAADTARGGAIVVHTGEWPRPMFDKFPEFKEFPKEDEKAVLRLVDERTGDVQAIKKDMPIYEPVEIRDPKTGEVINYERDESGDVKIIPKTFDEIVKEEKKFHPELSPEKAFINHYYKSESKRMHAESLFWGSTAIEARKQIERELK
ncbi:unnamed protein product, partial [marine sediment metagenome]